MPGRSHSDGAGLCRRILGRFIEIHPGEEPTALLLALNLFVLLLAYYLLKNVREVLILGTPHGGAELKIYSNAAQALLLIGISLAFGTIASRSGRMRLLTVTTLFFACFLVLFYFLFLAWPTRRLQLSVAFYIWIGCFNTTSIAALWGFASDLYPRERGERLFPLVGAGGALGALAGAALAAPLYRQIGLYSILLVASGFLLATLLLTRLLHRREPAYGATDVMRPRDEAIGNNGTLSLLRRDSYLLLIAALSLVKNWVNSAGEYILDRQLVAAAHAAALQHHTGQAGVQAFIALFKAHYLTYTSALVVVLQFFLVGRVIKHVGVARSLLVAPLLSLLGYGWAAAQLTLGVLLVVKVGENGADYSLQKTAEQALYLVTPRQAKYKVKMVVDTFLVRAGDVLAATVVWVGTTLGLRTRDFIAINIVLTVGWIAVVLGLIRVRRRRLAPRPARSHVPERSQPSRGGRVLNPSRPVSAEAPRSALTSRGGRLVAGTDRSGPSSGVPASRPRQAGSTITCGTSCATSSIVPSLVPSDMAVAAPAAVPSRSPASIPSPRASATPMPATSESPEPTALRCAIAGARMRQPCSRVTHTAPAAPSEITTTSALPVSSRAPSSTASISGSERPSSRSASVRLGLMR